MDVKTCIILRVIPEEALRIIFSGSSVGLNHPYGNIMQLS